MLMILDGWGIGKRDFTDGIFNAKTPFIDSLYQSVPNTTLTTFGNAVGLPEGQMGNSEVGHMNIGAGRVVWQQLALINRKFEDGSAADEPGISNLAEYCIGSHKPLHLIGLVSDGGVHSSMEHLVSLCKILTNKGVREINIHAFTDGRDTDPKSGIVFLNELESAIAGTNARIVSVIGRYYAMDRDQRWERIKKAYDLMVHGRGDACTDACEALRMAYDKGITDEFIPPTVITNAAGMPLAQISENDAVLCFNFRTDRGRQISRTLTQEDFPEYALKKMPLYYATMTEYDATFRQVHVLFATSDVQNTLGEVLSKAGKKQLRSAETEKYPHVTFFFSGGREMPFEGEDRIMEPSPKVATYDLQPEMSAPALTEKMAVAISSQQYDFICLNFANTDMVGHTGVWEAILKAAETVDACAEKLVKLAVENQYRVMIIADHGNSDEARNPDGSPNTAHSMNPVPCFVISPDVRALKGPGKLADVAPTVLKLMGLAQPPEMNGNVLY